MSRAALYAVDRFADRIWGVYTRISLDPLSLYTGVADQGHLAVKKIAQIGGTPPDLTDRTRLYEENDTSAWKRRKVTITDHYGETREAYRVVRPVFAKAMRDLRAGKINALMIYDLDRLARDEYDLADAIEAVEHFGATIVSATASEIDLMTESGRMAARIMVTMANKSSADTARRVKRAHERGRMTGNATGSIRPFGFGRSDVKWSKQTDAEKATHNEREATMIQKAANDVLNGITIMQITEEWIKSGVPTTRNGIWRHRTVRQLLKSPRIAGWRTYEHGIALDENGEQIRGQWDPILDQDTWDRLQVALSPRNSRGRVPRRGARHYLLTGLLRCGKCNNLMYGNARHTDRPMRHYYVCKGQDHGTLSIAGVPTDETIDAMMMDRLQQERLQTEAPVFAGSARLEEVKEKIQEYLEGFNQGHISGDTMWPQVRKLEIERDALKAARDEFIAATAGPSTRLTPEEWEKSTPAEKRAHLEKDIEAIMVKPTVNGKKAWDRERLVVIWRND